MIETANKCSRGSATPHTPLPHSRNFIHVCIGRLRVALYYSKWEIMMHQANQTTQTIKFVDGQICFVHFNDLFDEQNFVNGDDRRHMKRWWNLSISLVYHWIVFTLRGDRRVGEDRNEISAEVDETISYNFELNLNCMRTNNSHVAINSAYLFIVGIKWINSPSIECSMLVETNEFRTLNGIRLKHAKRTSLAVLDVARNAHQILALQS